VWDADHAGFLIKIDPRTMRAVARTRLDFGPHGVIATRRTVYVADAHGDRLIIADPHTARVERVKNLPIGPIYPVMGGGSIWTVSEEGWDVDMDEDRVVRIDPTTLRIQQTIHLGSNGLSVAFGFGSAWVALRDGHVVRVTQERA
jgi:hypothetical protein